MNLCVIPARGGSKRIPRKNIRFFAGKPMISYAIEAARQCGLFRHIIVSTEDNEIAGVAEKLGAEIPFRRPEELADDYTGTNDVVAHAIAACERLGYSSEWVCCIYPAVPFICSDDIKRAFELLKNTNNIEYSFPVARFPSAIQRALRRNPSGVMESFYPECETARTQDLEEAFHDAGQFYWGRRESWSKNARIHNSGIGLVIPSWRVVDIDTPQDWERAERIFAARL